MRAFIPVIVVAAAFGCYADDMNNTPVVKVDNEHLMLQRSDGSQAKLYHISPCAGVILDATDYTFDIPIQIKDRPLNSIQVVQDKNRKLAAE